jgi:RNA polymerase sigma-70 factor, ECF subfamily
MDRKEETPPSDEEIVRRFLHGETAAFDHLVLKYRKEIYRIAYRITGNHGEADDLAQETFCRAYEGLRGFRGEASLKTWLCRIVSNLSLNEARSARVAKRDDATVEELAESGDEATLQAPIGADGLVQREREERLRQAIGELPRRQRVTLILRAFEGLPYKEIATVMDCTTGTAKANFFHAVASLRRALKDLL